MATTTDNNCTRARRVKRLEYKKLLSQRRKYEERVVNGVRFGMRTLRAQPSCKHARRFYRVSLSVRSPTLSEDVERDLVTGVLGIASSARTPERAWRLVYKWKENVRQFSKTKPIKGRCKRWVPRLSSQRTDYLVRFGSHVVASSTRVTAKGLRVLGGINRVLDWTFWSTGVVTQVGFGVLTLGQGLFETRYNPFFEVARASRFYRYHQRRMARWLEKKAKLIDVYSRRGLKKRWVGAAYA